MSIVAVGFVPATPLLVPVVAGGSAHLDDDLRAACRDVVALLLSDDPDTVEVVGSTDEPSAALPDSTPWSVHGFGVGERPLREALPWPLGAGAYLLDEAGWSGGRRYVTGDLDAADRVAALVVGDGSARRSERAPGHFDDRAAGFDARVAALLGSGDVHSVADLDLDLAAELMASGPPMWRAVAQALGDRAVETADVLYDAAPYGVQYFSAYWKVALPG